MSPRCPEAQLRTLSQLLNMMEDRKPRSLLLSRKRMENGEYTILTSRAVPQNELSTVGIGDLAQQRKVPQLTGQTEAQCSGQTTAKPARRQLES
jgi:hypothetical protein